MTRDRLRPRAVVVATVATLAALGLVAGVPGVGVALLVGVVAYAAGPVVGFAAGHLLLLVLLPDPSGVPVAVAEHGLGSLLVVGAADATGSWRVGALAGFGFVAVASVFVGAIGAFDSLPSAAAATAAVVGLVGYGLHRYELVSLGLVAEAEP